MVYAAWAICGLAVGVALGMLFRHLARRIQDGDLVLPDTAVSCTVCAVAVGIALMFWVLVVVLR